MTDHPNAEDYRNRAERAEQALAERDAEIAWLRRDDFIATADALARGDHKESQP